MKSLWLAMLLSTFSAHAFGPFATLSNPVTSDCPDKPLQVGGATRGRGGPTDTFFRFAYDFYRFVVSSADGPRCAHRPTCSRYGLEAVRRHGAVGMLLTIDRLWRSGDSSAVRGLRLLNEGETLALHDPLEESTFWFPSP